MELSSPDRNGVFVLTMNDGRENRMTEAFFAAFNQHLDLVEQHKGPTALVVVGAGKFWSNGFDFDYLEVDSPGAVRNVHSALRRLLSLSVPCVAAINGHAMAGGAMLALAFDFRVMREDRGYIGVNELALGMSFTKQMCDLFRWKVPIAARSKFVLLGHRMTPPEALAAGLVDELRKEADVLKGAIEIAAKLAPKGKRKDVWGRTKVRLHPPFDPSEGIELPRPTPPAVPSRDGDITYEVSDGIAVLRLNRPKKGNAWTKAMSTRFLDLLEAAEHDQAVRVVLLTAAGRHFCVGVDMSQLEMLEDKTRPFYAARQLAKPVICALNGSCAGIGLALACHCDVRFCAGHAKLTVAYPRRGLVAEHGLSWALPNIVGIGHAADLAISGRTVTAAEAHRMGLVNFLVPKGRDVFSEARAYALDLAKNVSPGAMAAVKYQLQAHMHLTQEEAVKESNELMHLSEKCEDLDEGFQSFKERRPPHFQPISPDHPLVPSRARRAKL